MPFEHDLFCSFGCKNKEENKMTEIKGILLIPEEGDPRGLLKEGPCGARPPFAVRIRYGDMKTLCYVWRAGPYRESVAPL